MFRVAGAAVFAVVGFGLVMLLIAWSGVYNVAATRGHWAVVEWLLTFGMKNSVATHSIGITAPRLDNADLIRLGAGHFHSGCASCHAVPGMAMNPIARQMLPPPSDLTRTLGWSAAELFWIVKHGIKYTGMPGWPAADRDDEIWAVVAFLQKMPSLTPGEYYELAVSHSVKPPHGPIKDSIFAIAACAGCHGAGGQLPKSNLVPVLHGQPVEYLQLALQSYADGRRKSGFMQPVASELTVEERQQAASYYAGLPVPTPATSRPNPVSFENGRVLAVDGLPASGIPPCLACHGPNALPTFPRLVGQHSAYIAGQLHLWRRGLRAATEGAAIMAPLAQRLTEQQVTDVSTYFGNVAPAASNRTQAP